MTILRILESILIGSVFCTVALVAIALAAYRDE